MTLVDIRKMTELQRTFEMLARKQYLSQVELDQSYASLKNLSGMQQVRRTLEYIMEDIQQEAQLLSQMEKCLEQTCRAFSISEDYIAEHAEESKLADSRYDLFEAVTIPDSIFRLLR